MQCHWKLVSLSTFHTIYLTYQLYCSGICYAHGSFYIHLSNNRIEVNLQCCVYLIRLLLYLHFYGAITLSRLLVC